MPVLPHVSPSSWRWLGPLLSCLSFQPLSCLDPGHSLWLGGVSPVVEQHKGTQDHAQVGPAHT